MNIVYVNVTIRQTFVTAVQMKLRRPNFFYSSI